jgi:hypothetical protein
MDPAFAELLNQLKAQGFTDSMFDWLVGLPADEWGNRVRTISGWLGTLNPQQRAAFQGQRSFADAQAFINNLTAPPPAPSTPATPEAPAETPQTSSAFGVIRTMLEDFGLGTLANWAWARYQEGVSVDQIMIELYQRPEFKAVYPEYEQLARKGRAYSVAELQAYRKAVVGIYQMYGIPESFYDSVEDLATLAAGEVSIAEVSKRVAQAAEAAYQSSPLVRQEMERMYGVGPGGLIAYFLDPSKAEPIIRQNYISAQIGAQSRQTGYGLLTQQEAQSLAGMGVDQNTAQRGFSELAASQELFGALDAGEYDISRETQLGAAFGGDADAQQQVERRRSRRLAEFQEGGGFATTAQGIAGVA